MTETHGATSGPALTLLRLAMAVAIGGGCSASERERCNSYCDACDLGYCMAGGGSGWCSPGSRQACILAAADDCDALLACVMGPHIDASTTADAGTRAADIERCVGYCTACMFGPCIAGGESGHCQGPSLTSRRDCILATEGDCDEMRECFGGPDGGPLDAGADDEDAGL